MVLIHAAAWIYYDYQLLTLAQGKQGHKVQI